jgi:8-oxo-dGTP pyrophosphatase MutT (NUDIX family)
MSNLKKWELLQEEEISPSEWFPLFRHTVKLPNGQIVDDYYVSDLGDVAMILPITTDGQIIVIKEYKHGADDFIWLFPAGRVGPQQEPLIAAKKELKEETGYEAAGWQLLGQVYPAPSKNKTQVNCFLATDCELTSNQDLEKTEAIQVHKISWTQWEQMVEQNKANDSNALATMVFFKKKYPQLVEKLGEQDQI